MFATCEAPSSADIFMEPQFLWSSNFSTEVLLRSGAVTYSFGYILNLINHIFICLVTVGMTVQCFKMKLEKTAMHAFLCTFGFVFLCCEAMMARYNFNILTRSLSPTTKTNIHLSLHLLGGLLGIVGTVHKSIQKKRHFHTTHGRYGIAACVFFVLNIIFGLVNYFAVRHPHITNTIDFLHNALGIVTFLLVMLCQYFGYNTGFFRRNFKNKEAYYKLLTCAIISITILGPFKMFISKMVKIYT